MQVDLVIANKKFSVECNEDEKVLLEEAAKNVKSHLDLIKETKLESKALMVSLNLAYSLLELNTKVDKLEEKLNTILKEME